MEKENRQQNISRRKFISTTGVAAASLSIIPSLAFGRNRSDLMTPGVTGESNSLLNLTPHNFKNEIVRLKMLAPGAYGTFMVEEQGVQIPYQVEEIDGKSYIWVCSDFAPMVKRSYEVRSGSPEAFAPKVTVREENGFFILENRSVHVKVPSVAGTVIPGPVAGIKLPDGKLAGGSVWNTGMKLKKFTAKVTGDGTIFGKVSLRYDFDGMGGIDKTIPAFAEIDIMLAPEWNHAAIFERHEMTRSDSWEFIASKGWTPNAGVSKQFNNGPGGDGVFDVPPMNRPLLPIVNVCFAPDLYINLIPRWNQHFKDGWAFAATDGLQSLSVVVVRASQWKWPHDNNLECVVKPSGDYAGVRGSTWRGQRLWWLAPSQAPVNIEYVSMYAWESLDKINHEYILEWPGKKTTWWSINQYNSGQTNPTGKIRSIGKAAMKNAGAPAEEDTLIRFQTLIHEDCWGSYWNYWSPENPNFFTDFNIVPIALATNLKGHPQFETFRRQAEMKFREDIYHSVTMPDGAGQECPGYAKYAKSSSLEIAEMGKKYLGFDMEFFLERIDAAAHFYNRISYPDGDIRRGSPMGDSHPDRKSGTGMPPVEVENSEVKRWTTEELKGFGVAFTNNPGTDKETYLAFKSGPNRGHFHGDQLAFHYCADARPLVVDHHCSYHPRAGQEHMHNRLAFFTDEMPYTNMDGYEHVLAVKTSDDVDISVGQVESNRLRQVRPTPPEAWDARYPQLQFGQPLIYRRTVVFMKNGAQDYFVFRDQYWADRPLKSAYCLHTYGNEAVQKGQIIDFGKLTLFCATPSDFLMKNLNWEHENGGHEETRGVRLESKGQTGEFITVMFPGNDPPIMEAIPNGVRIGDDVITFAGAKPTYGGKNILVNVKRAGKQLLKLTGKDIDFNRWQGEVGLFVPDTGYPFGDIPDWLVSQRGSKPKWATMV